MGYHSAVDKTKDYVHFKNTYFTTLHTYVWFPDKTLHNNRC